MYMCSGFQDDEYMYTHIFTHSRKHTTNTKTSKSGSPGKTIRLKLNDLLRATTQLQHIETCVCMNADIVIAHVA